MNKVVSEILGNVFMPLLPNSGIGWLSCWHGSQTGNVGAFTQHGASKTEQELSAKV